MTLLAGIIHGKNIDDCHRKMRGAPNRVGEEGGETTDPGTSTSQAPGPRVRSLDMASKPRALVDEEVLASARYCETAPKRLRFARPCDEASSSSLTTKTNLQNYIILYPSILHNIDIDRRIMLLYILVFAYHIDIDRRIKLLYILVFASYRHI